VVLVPTPTLGPAELQLGEVAFQFQDPPQPGANVLLSVVIHNPTDGPGGLVSLDLPTSWLSGYAIRGIDPLPVDESLAGQKTGSKLRFTFDGPAAGSDLHLALFLATTDEVIDGPNLRVVDAQGREIGHALPPTEAPAAVPGPVYAIDIPRLHLHTGVVQVEWEPPLFVVGQLRASAYVTEGNSVLVGHLRGAAGYNVFDHLDQLSVGDQVIARSRGETYEFVVSQTQVLPEEDMSPTEPTATPRLTLMTCAGDWNPLTRDYPQRLWVVAKPTDAAKTASQSVNGISQPKRRL
jgi:LPXTG-site transpeptidase (sortase) family protein